MHNKIALKLTLYFAAVLLVFALVVGGSFAHFFREHTVDIKSTELKQRAVRIAEVLSENAGWLEKRGGMVISSEYGAQIALTAALPEPGEAVFAKALQELSAGSLVPERTGTELRGVRVR